VALIPCYECRREVSTLAAMCPNCGAPVPPAACDTEGRAARVGADRELAGAAEKGRESVGMPRAAPASPSTSSSGPQGCPYCGASDVATCAMAYAQGTSSGSAYGSAWGASSSATFVGLSESQTRLAAMSAPPQKSSIGCLLWTGAGIGALFVMVGYMASSVAAMVFGALLSLGGAALGIKVSDGESADHNVEMSAWRDQWVCMRCGEKFTRRGSTPLRGRLL